MGNAGIKMCEIYGFVIECCDMFTHVARRVEPDPDAFDGVPHVTGNLINERTWNGNVFPGFILGWFPMLTIFESQSVFASICHFERNQPHSLAPQNFTLFCFGGAHTPTVYTMSFNFL